MAAAEAGASGTGRSARSASVYDGFISYSHAADDLFAPRLQSGLQRFAKPWWKRRALRLFRDEASLSANPHLWSSITEALDNSEWFVLLLSPDAAVSPWVNQEIEYWKTHKDPSHILPVLTDGSFGWVGGEVTGSAVPGELVRGVFSEEPRWVDLRFAKDEEQLDLKDPRFANAVADVASALRGVPKDELASEEVIQHRRTVRTAWAAGVLVATLAVAAVVFGIQSADNARIARKNAEAARANEARAVANASEAESQRRAALESEATAISQAERADRQATLAKSRELAAASIGVLEDDPELGMLLSLESVDQLAAAGLSYPPEVLSALWNSYSRQRVELTIPGAGYAASALSPSGDILATDLETERQTATIWSADTGDQLGRLEAGHLAETSGGSVRSLRFTADGSRIMVARGYGDGFPQEVAVVDIYDVETFELESTLFGPPGEYEAIDISPDGYILATTYEPARTLIWSPESGEAPVAVLENLYAPAFTLGGHLVGYDRDELMSILIVDWRSQRVVDTIPAELEVGRLTLAPDRSLVAVSGPASQLAIYDTSSGEEVLKPTLFPDPQNHTWSPDGSLLAVSGNDADVTLLEPSTGEILLKLSGHDASIYSMAWSGNRIATVEFGGGEARIWNVGPGLPSAGNVEVEGGWGILDPIPAGTGFLRTYPGRHVDVLSLDGMVRASAGYNTYWPTLGVISGDGETIGGEYDDGRTSVIDLATGRETLLPKCHSPRALSWDGTLAAVDTGASCSEPGLRSGLMDIATGDMLIELEEPVLFLASFSPDGRYVAFITEANSGSAPDLTNSIDVWSVDDRKQLLTIEDSLVGTPWLIPRFSGDGRYLGVGTNGPAAVVIDMDLVESGAVEEEFVVFNQEVNNGNTVRAIPNSDGLLVTMGHDGFYRFWEIDSGELIIEVDVRGRVDRTLSHGFSRDGETLYYMAETELISQIPTDPDEMIEEVRAAVTRTLTDDECTRYLHTDGCIGTP